MRWVILAALIAVVFYRGIPTSPPLLCCLALGLYALSNVVFYFEKPGRFELQRVWGWIFFFDIAVIAIVTYYCGVGTGEFYVAYFLAILVAAMSRRTSAAIIASLAAAFIYGLMTYYGKTGVELFSQAFFIRTAFFLATAVFVGFITEEVQYEAQKRKALAGEVEEKSRELSLSRAYLDNVITSMTDPLFVVRPDGVIEMANRAACKILLRSQREVVGKEFKQVFANPETSILEPDILRRWLSQEVLRSYESVFVNASGEKIPVSMNCSVNRRPDGLFSSVIVTARDMRDAIEAESIRRQMEEKMMRQRLEAEGMHKKLEAEEKVVAELKRLDKLKSDFVSIVSHELKTPMTSVRLALEMIDDGMLGEVTQEQKEKLKLAIRNIDRLIMLIEDVLSVSRIESGKLILYREKAPLLSVIERVVAQLSESARSARAEVLIAQPVFDVRAYFDANAISQVLTNLIGNAIVHNKGGTKITISWQSEDDKEVKVAVIDNGKGIPKEELENIFQQFYQLHNEHEGRPKGTGLGLSISRSIVEAHRGKIWCESDPGKGAKFLFTLPTEKPL
jgi:PAS domain S-box-containing protein